MAEAVPVSSELEQVFDALVEVAARLVREGRGPRAAAVKVAMQRHLGDFSEQRFGFSSFRSFLHAAEQAGRIQLRPASPGPDVDVVPIGVELPSSAHPRTTNRLRRDVWDAFTRWDDGYLRFWDRTRDRAVRIPDGPVPGEDEDQASMRAAFLAHAPDLVAIEHVPVETLVSWAREFAEGLPPDPMRTALFAALDQDLPIHNFTQLVRRLGLGPRWHDAHVGRVRQVVEKWAGEHGLQIDFARDVAVPDRRPEHGRGPRASMSLASESDLRRRVHELVDAMTTPELLNLTVPLRLVIDDR